MIIVVEEDNVLRLLDVLFEPELPRERFAALADYFAHDGVDLDSWRNSVRRRVPGLFPSTLRFVSEQHGLRTSLSNAEAVVVEGLEVGEAELGRAESLRVVCKFGTVTDNINVPACERRGVQVQSVRRRTNIAVARTQHGPDAGTGQKNRDVERPGHRRAHQRRGPQLPSL